MNIASLFDTDPLDWPRYAGLTIERYNVVRRVAGAMVDAYHIDNEWGAFEEYRGLTDNEEINVLWAILRNYSSLRAAIKKLGQSERAGH